MIGHVVVAGVDAPAVRAVPERLPHPASGQVGGEDRQRPTLPLRVAQEAYYAKTGFLLLLLILMVFGVSFPLGFAVSFSAYAIMMSVFFGVKLPTALYLAAAVALLATYLIDKRHRA